MKREIIKTRGKIGQGHLKSSQEPIIRDLLSFDHIKCKSVINTRNAQIRRRFRRVSMFG